MQVQTQMIPCFLKSYLKVLMAITLVTILEEREILRHDEGLDTGSKLIHQNQNPKHHQKLFRIKRMLNNQVGTKGLIQFMLA